MHSDIYIVDCENVGVRHFPCDTKKSLVFLIHSKSLPAGFVLDFHEFYIPVSHDGTKNALDFVLDTFAGYLIKTYGSDVTYHIISKDKGFQNVANFWGSLGFSFKLSPFHFDTEIANVLDKYNALTPKCKRKVYNVWHSWSNSVNCHTREALYYRFCQINLGKALNKTDLSILCDYAMKYGMESVC